MTSVFSDQSPKLRTLYQEASHIANKVVFLFVPPNDFSFGTTVLLQTNIINYMKVDHQFIFFEFLKEMIFLNSELLL